MIRFEGHYFDGKTSRSHDVVFTLDGPNVLRVEGLEEPVSYSLEEVRVGPRLGDTTRSLRFEDGAKGETDDNASADELVRRQGARAGSNFLHRMESSWRWTLGSLVLLFALTFAGFRWGVPLLARRAAHAVPAELAYDLGKGSLAILEQLGFAPTALSKEDQERLTLAFTEMAEDYPELPLSLEFRGGVPPNALALPDGTVLLTDALVELADDDRQVLAVLAHEIGHVHHRHAVRMALEKSAVALVVSTLLGDVSALTSLSAALPAFYVEAGYSREHEWEADTFALDYLRAHGIDPRHFADAMGKLQEALGGTELRQEDSGSLQYLSSHPPTPRRIARFEAHAFSGVD